MSKILSGFTLSFSKYPILDGFKEVVNASVYQVEALGIKKQRADDAYDVKNGVSFHLLHPSITPIRCDVFGWSETSCYPATDHTVQAGCELMSVHGRASGKAQNLGVEYVSTLTASLSVQGMLAAAIGQLRGGHFTQVKTSLLHGGLLGIGQYLASATAEDDPDSLLPGCTDSELRPPFISADGVVFEMETLSPEPWRCFWRQVGLDARIAGQAWRAYLMRYAKAVSPLPSACLHILAQLPLAKIQEIATENGISLTRVRSFSERMRDSNFAAELQQGPWRFSTTSGSERALPSLSAQADLPLQGIRVIESCRRIQGPLIGHLLATLGADVIRLELPGGDPLRAMPPSANGCSVRFDALNHLKQAREIDIKSAQGRKEVETLVQTADVFLHNWAPGKAAQLGLDYDDLARMNPAIIYAYAGGWGDHDKDIPLTATDFMVQAWSGVADLIGRSSQTRGGTLFTALDLLGGVIGAQGVLAALLNRAINKQGIYVESSLLGAANVVCSSKITSEVAPLNVQHNTLKKIYSTLDNKLIAIECLDAVQFDQLMHLLDVPLDSDETHRDVELQTSIFTNTAQYWQEKINNLNIPVAIVTQDIACLADNISLNGDIKTEGYSKVNTYWRFQ